MPSSFCGLTSIELEETSEGKILAGIVGAKIGYTTSIMQHDDNKRCLYVDAAAWLDGGIRISFYVCQGHISLSTHNEDLFEILECVGDKAHINKLSKYQCWVNFKLADPALVGCIQEVVKRCTDLYKKDEEAYRKEHNVDEFDCEDYGPEDEFYWEAKDDED